ncbi:MAG: hypothetical protein V9G14_15455 [Cypionkella sp.]
MIGGQAHALAELGQHAALEDRVEHLLLDARSSPANFSSFGIGSTSADRLELILVVLVQDVVAVGLRQRLDAAADRVARQAEAEAEGQGQHAEQQPDDHWS